MTIFFPRLLVVPMAATRGRGHDRGEFDASMERSRDQRVHVTGIASNSKRATEFLDEVAFCEALLTGLYPLL